MTHSPYCGCDQCLGAPATDPALPVLFAVSEAFGVTCADLLGPKKDERHRRARAAAFLLVREVSGLSYPKAAAALHRTDHTTAISGYERAKVLLDRDERFRGAVALARAKLETARCV